MLTFIIFIIVLSILVLVHEFGHFYIARKSGMKVEEFGFGFPPRIFKIKKGETIYSLNLIPFGGFVRIFGEEGENKEDPRSFSSKSVNSRAKVVIAGVLMNLILATILLIIGNIIGLRIGLLDKGISENAKDIKIQILQTAPDSPAQKSGLKLFDEIIKLEFKNDVVQPKNIKDVQDFVKKYAGQEITLTILRNKNELKVNLVPRINPPEDQGALGVSLVKTGVVSYPWYRALWQGIRDTGVIIANTVLAFGIFFKNLFISRKVIADVSGPVGIAILIGHAANLGFNYLVQFVALLSINLAILNIIPFPALDGGRLFLLMIEKVKKSPLDKRIENLINIAGFAFLIILMILITIRDLLKFF